MLAHWSYNSY